MNHIVQANAPSLGGLASRMASQPDGDAFAASLKSASHWPQGALTGDAPQNLIAALPLAVPAAAAGAATMVAMAAVAGIGIGWNTLSTQERQLVRAAVTELLSDMLQRGVVALSDLSGALQDLGQLPQEVGPAIRQAVAEALQVRLPSLEQTIEAVESLPVVAECQAKDPEELIGMCGRCTSDAFAQLREMGIRRITQESVANGAHYVLKIHTKEGDYILDCTIGQFGGDVKNPDGPWQQNNLLKDGGNSVLMKEELYRRLLQDVPARFYL